MAQPISVVVVDDSHFMRRAITKILEQDGRFRVVGQAENGVAGVETVAKHKPQVVTMDFNMPLLNGVEAVRRIMAQTPVPIVMVSAHTREGAKETLDALEAGAVDFVTKTSGEVSSDISQVAPVLLEKLLLASLAEPTHALRQKPTNRPMSSGITRPVGLSKTRKIVVIGISTGGPAALASFLPSLPRRTQLSLAIVQHMPATFTEALAHRLDDLCSMKIREARQGDTLKEGVALIAPGGKHLTFAPDGSVRLNKDDPVHGCRPSVDVTMTSAAEVFGRSVVGVIMTGMGRDGAEGMAAIKTHGGLTLAQDQASAVIYGMPKACLEQGIVDHVVNLSDLAQMLTQLE